MIGATDGLFSVGHAPRTSWSLGLNSSVVRWPTAQRMANSPGADGPCAVEATNLKGVPATDQSAHVGAYSDTLSRRCVDGRDKMSHGRRRTFLLEAHWNGRGNAIMRSLPTLPVALLDADQVGTASELRVVSEHALQNHQSPSFTAARSERCAHRRQVGN